MKANGAPLQTAISVAFDRVRILGIGEDRYKPCIVARIALVFIF